jgi:hypothetical protein
MKQSAQKSRADGAQMSRATYARVRRIEIVLYGEPTWIYVMDHNNILRRERN